MTVDEKNGGGTEGGKARFWRESALRVRGEGEKIKGERRERTGWKRETEGREIGRGGGQKE